MKIRLIVAITTVMLFFNSCITKDTYKETDIYEEFETEEGFGVFHIPPVLFRIAFSISDEQENGDISKDLLNKVEVLKVMFFEEKENTITLDDLKNSMNEKVKNSNYNLLTRIAHEKSDISIFVINHEELIREVLITIVSEKDYISLNLIGELTQEEVMKVYKAVNMKEIVNFGN